MTPSRMGNISGGWHSELENPPNPAGNCHAECLYGAVTVATARSRSAPARGYLSDGAHRTRPWPLLDEPVEIKVYDVDDVERLARWRAHETEVGLQVFVTAARRPASAALYGCRVVYVRLSVGARVRLSLAAGFVRNGLNWFWAWRLRPTFLHCVGWLGSRVVSVLESGAKGPGFKSQPRRCRITVLGKLFTPVTKQRN